MKSNPLSNLESYLPDSLTPGQRARAKTIFFKELSLRAHAFYKGKMMTIPKAGFYGFDWFNVWYTPGVSKVSTTIRDDNMASFELSNRGNSIAIISDSTRVLGDGDVTPSGGLGVMEGKAFLMKYLGGLDSTPLCINSRGNNGKPNPKNIIRFANMVQHSFAAINLEDISQPNCFKVLDTLQHQCNIPVWHDDAQGTGSVALAGLINALKLADKELQEAKIVFLGAGAANTATARLVIAAGGDAKNMILFDSRGALSTERADIASNRAFYRKWELCLETNPRRINTIEQAVKGADALIAISRPGPDVIQSEWITAMAPRPIVFALANPIPEIYPHTAHKAGAFIVATGRGDFPNQVNNSLGFPGILKGAVLAEASHITDEMAITAARTLAQYAQDRGITPESILPTMGEHGIFSRVAAEVAMQAIENGVARRIRGYEAYRKKAHDDIIEARELYHHLMDSGYIKSPPESMIREAIKIALTQVT